MKRRRGELRFVGGICFLGAFSSNVALKIFYFFAQCGSGHDVDWVIRSQTRPQWISGSFTSVLRAVHLRRDHSGWTVITGLNMGPLSFRCHKLEMPSDIYLTFLGRWVICDRVRVRRVLRVSRRLKFTLSSRVHREAGSHLARVLGVFCGCEAVSRFLLLVIFLLLQFPVCYSPAGCVEPQFVYWGSVHAVLYIWQVNGLKPQ